MHIGRHYQGRPREYTDKCSYCGVTFHRGELTLNAEGFLACEDDRSGRTAIEIDYQRAMDSSVPTTINGKKREGPG